MRGFLYYLQEANVRWKAGGIPFVHTSTGTFVCLFKSNDPTYGGAAPQIPKGTPDLPETPEQTARREVSEETGIPTTAFRASIPLTVKMFRGETSDYEFHCYGFEVESQVPVHANAEGIGIWLRADEALRTMRLDQRPWLHELLVKVERRTTTEARVMHDLTSMTSQMYVNPTLEELREASIEVKGSELLAKLGNDFTPNPKYGETYFFAGGLFDDHDMYIWNRLDMNHSNAWFTLERANRNPDPLMKPIYLCYYPDAKKLFISASNVSWGYGFDDENFERQEYPPTKMRLRGLLKKLPWVQNFPIQTGIEIFAERGKVL